MTMKSFTSILIFLFFVTSCNYSNNIETYEPTWSNDSLRIRTFIAFFDIDYEKALDETIRNSKQYSYCNIDFFSRNPNNKTPVLLYISTPDCSFCITSTLDFIYTLSLIDNINIPLPVVILKDGDTDIFEFYKQEFINNLDSTNTKALYLFNNFHTINNCWGSINEAADGVYLLYGNRVVNFMEWPPINKVL